MARPSHLTGQFAAFAFVGAVSTALHFLVLVVTHQALGVPLILATTIGYIAGAGANYALNRRMTFVANRRHAVTLPRFLLVVGFGLLLNAGLMAAQAVLAGDVPYLLRQCVATGMVLVANFTLHRLWIYPSGPVRGDA